ncbi:hypothetical protein DSUL_50271 [Desulfovibrionales bacterium]
MVCSYLNSVLLSCTTDLTLVRHRYYTKTHLSQSCLVALFTLQVQLVHQNKDYAFIYT